MTGVQTCALPIFGADGVVVTGAGPPIRVAGQPDRHPRVLDGRSYWLHEHAISTRVAQNACVIGSGETAASVVISLVSKLPKHSSVDVLTSRGVLYSRGESYEENHLYSDPGDWPGLAEATPTAAKIGRASCRERVLPTV